jgi:hypothetical protein
MADQVTASEITEHAAAKSQKMIVRPWADIQPYRLRHSATLILSSSGDGTTSRGGACVREPKKEPFPSWNFCVCA